MICSSQSVPSARAVRADFFWQIYLEMKIFISLFYLSALSKIVIKHQNASVRDNIYNAHVGFREWE